MGFVDDLTLILDLLVLVSAAVFYTAMFTWWHARKNDSARAQAHLKEGAGVLGLIGGILGAISLWGEMAWPLPGPYNIYFFDPLLMLALVLVGFAIAVWRRLPTHFVGMLSLVIGAGVAYYGARAYLLGLTQDPFETLLLYLGFGAVGILAFPATLYVDWAVQGHTEPGASPLASNWVAQYPRFWTAIVVLFLLLVILAGFAALAYGFNTVWSHLGSPP